MLTPNNSTLFPQLPPQLFKLGDSLRTLDLSGNKFKSLPPEIGDLTGLKNLTLSSNRFG